MWITYQILLHAGKENQQVNHWILKSEFLAKLKYQILEMDGERLQPLAVDLLFEICRVQSLKPRDLGKYSFQLVLDRLKNASLDLFCVLTLLFSSFFPHMKQTNSPGG